MSEQVTRFELIDDRGRVYMAYPNRVDVSYQDGGRTLKVFVCGHSEANRTAHKLAMAESLKSLKPEPPR